MSNLKKYSLIALLAVGICFAPSIVKAASDTIVNMGNQKANKDETYNQARIDSKGEGLISVVNSEILAKDYSYEKNKNVKSAVDKKVTEMKDSGTDYVSEYNVKNELELLEKTGSILDAQESEYTKQQYYKEYVTDKTLKKLYDEKKGELTSYSVIKIDTESFNNDQTKIDAAKKDIEAKLAKATEKDVKDIFAELAKKYQTSDESNGEQAGVSRDNVDEGLLKTIDSYKYMQFSKKAVEVDGVSYYILKTDKGERPSFKSSKEKLKGIQYEEATQANSYLEDYLLMKLREKHKITFKNADDKKIYDAANAEIVSNYNEAEKGGEE